MFRPNRTFQLGLDQNKTRRQRQHNSLGIRRGDREEKLQCKRKKILTSHRNNSLTNSIRKYIKNSNNWSNQQNCIKSIQAINKILYSNQNANISDDTIIQFVVMKLLQHKNPMIQFELMSSIQYFISKNHKLPTTDGIILNHALDRLIQLSEIPRYSILKMIVLTFHTIGIECNIQSQQIKINILTSLSNLCAIPYDKKYYFVHYDSPSNSHAQYVQLMDTLSSTIATLALKIEHMNLKYKSLMIDCLSRLIKSQNNLKQVEKKNINIRIGVIMENVTYAQKFEHSNNLLDYMINTNVLGNVMKYFKHCQSRNEYDPIIKCIGNILAADTKYKYTQILIDYDILNTFYIIFKKLKNKSDSDSLKTMKELCFCVANMNVCYKLDIIMAVINANIFPILCHLLRKQNIIANEALYAICNAVETVIENGNNNIMNYFCNTKECNLVYCLAKYYKQHFTGIVFGKNQQILNLSLDCLENILMYKTEYQKLFEENNGLNVLENIQSNDRLSEQMYDKIERILQEHFKKGDVIMDTHDSNKINEQQMIPFELNLCGNTFEF